MLAKIIGSQIIIIKGSDDMNISEFDIAIESIFGDSFIGQKLRSLKMDFVSKKLINKFPGLDARGDKCIKSLAFMTFNCVKRHYENNAYFNSSEFKQYQKGKSKLSKDPTFKAPYTKGATENSVSIRYWCDLTTPMVSFICDGSESDCQKIAKPTFTKMEREFKAISSAAVKDVMSGKSELEKKCNCKISVAEIQPCSDIEVVEDNGKTRINYIQRMQIDYTIAFNV